jgi:hypothetical protein
MRLVERAGEAAVGGEEGRTEDGWPAHRQKVRGEGKGEGEEKERKNQTIFTNKLNTVNFY